MKILKYYTKYKLKGFFAPLTIVKLRLLHLDAFIDSTIQVKLADLKRFQIGEGSSINRFSTIIVANDPHQHLKNSELTIGDHTYIGEYNNIRAAGGEIHIGSKCLISQHITMVSSNHGIAKDALIYNQPWTVEHNFIVIEDDVWIGANSVILPGVTIKRGAVVGAGSVVTKDIPEYAIVCGNPARIVKYRE